MARNMMLELECRHCGNKAKWKAPGRIHRSPGMLFCSRCGTDMKIVRAHVWKIKAMPNMAVKVVYHGIKGLGTIVAEPEPPKESKQPSRIIRPR